MKYFMAQWGKSLKRLDILLTYRRRNGIRVSNATRAEVGIERWFPIAPDVIVLGGSGDDLC
jgi:hypothetical protein